MEEDLIHARNKDGSDSQSDDNIKILCLALTFDSLIIMCLIVDMRGLSYLEFGELLVFLYPNFSESCICITK